MLTLSKHLSWSAYFDNVNNNNILINEHYQSILNISSVENDRTSKINQLSSSKGEIVIIYHCNISKSIKLLHSIYDLGSSTWHNAPILVALDGVNKNRASPVLLDIDSIFSNFEIEIPTVTRLSSISSEDQVMSTDAPATNPQKFKSYPFIVLPPFLWKTVIDLDNKSPSKVFIECINTINSFATENRDVDTLNSISPNTCNRLLSFLWAASKDIIPSSIRIIPSGDDDRIQTWSENRHSTCIQKDIDNSSSSAAAAAAAAAKIASLEKEAELNLLIRDIEKVSDSSKDNSEKKGFAKLDDSVKNQILMASAPNREIAPGNPVETCENFFKQSSNGSARLHLTRSLKSKFGVEVDISSGTATALFNGGFNWSHCDSPNNFSIFSFPETSAFSRNIMTDCIVLQLKELSGKGLSNDDIKEALKQGIKIPDTIESMKYSFLNLLAACKFFFGEHALVVHSITKIHNHIVKNRQQYLSIAHQDEFFIAEFMFAFDTKLNLWLQSCEEAIYREDVDDNILDFEDELMKVKLRNFKHVLPSSIRKVISSSSKKKDEDNTTDGDSNVPANKKRKGNDINNKNNEGDQTKNNGTIKEWILEDKVYNKFLKSGPALKDRPKLNEVIICHRFHSKGYCFGNCNNKATHIPSNKLPANAKKSYSNWLTNTVGEPEN